MKEKDAVISKDGKHRYSLTRSWESDYKKICFCMLNPSVADATIDDPTIKRCCGFAKLWGFHGIEVVNLFAYRATEPRELLKVPYPVGHENDAHIWVAASCWPVVAAWGSWGDKFPERVQEVLGALRCCAGKVSCLGVTKGGQPKHPLYLAADTQLMEFK